MVAPMPWQQVNELIGQNIFRRFRIRELHPDRQERFIKWMIATLIGRWGYFVAGPNIIVGIEDPEDIEAFQLMFYESRKRRPIT